MTLLATALGSSSVNSFAPPTRLVSRIIVNNARFMAMNVDVPPPPSNGDIPMIQRAPGGAPSNIRYSDFIKLVNANQIEKVTFSADGSKLLGVDAEGIRLKIESLPSDPDLLTQLTSHKVRS